MATDFIAGFVSGIAGLIIGSPFDILKTEQQAGSSARRHLSLRSPRSWFSGLLAPVFGLGFLNAILFWSYALFMTSTSHGTSAASELLRIYVAGFISGLCVCFVSVPTELVKVKAQTSGESSWRIVRACLRESVIKGLFSGFVITIARDSIGYGFYFMSYEGLCWLLLPKMSSSSAILMSGGLAGCISWFSIFPLDTIKTRIQAEAAVLTSIEDESLLHARQDSDEMSKGDVLGIADWTVRIYHENGLQGFFGGLSVAMFRAFLVNAVIFWADTLIGQFLAHN